MTIYIVKEEDQIKYTSKILGAYRNKEKAIEKLNEESLLKKYSSEDKILDRYKDQIIIGYCDDEYYDGEWNITRILNVIEIEVE